MIARKFRALSFLGSYADVPLFPYDPAEVSVVDPVLVDVGSSDGKEAAEFLRRHGGSAYCLEPQTDLAPVFLKTVGTLPAWLFPVCLANGTGKLPLGNTGDALSLFCGGPESSFHAPCITLADFLREHALLKVDVLRMNCEGAEIMVLETWTDALTEIVCQITFSAHRHLVKEARYLSALEPLMDAYEIHRAETRFDWNVLLIRKVPPCPAKS